MCSGPDLLISLGGRRRLASIFHLQGTHVVGGGLRLPPAPQLWGAPGRGHSGWIYVSVSLTLAGGEIFHLVCHSLSIGGCHFVVLLVAEC